MSTPTHPNQSLSEQNYHWAASGCTNDQRSTEGSQNDQSLVVEGGNNDGRNHEATNDQGMPDESGN